MLSAPAHTLGEGSSWLGDTAGPTLRSRANSGFFGVLGQEARFRSRGHGVRRPTLSVQWGNRSELREKIISEMALDSETTSTIKLQSPEPNLMMFRIRGVEVSYRFIAPRTL